MIDRMCVKRKQDVKPGGTFKLNTAQQPAAEQVTENQEVSTAGDDSVTIFFLRLHFFLATLKTREA